MKITAELLRKYDPCKEELKFFVEEFGEGPAPLDDETAERYADYFDFNWAAKKLFPAPVYAEYRKITNVAYAEYEKISDVAYAEYACTEFNKKIALAFVRIARELPD